MKILLPVDGTSLSENETRFALRLVAEGLRAEFVLANVQEPPSFYELLTTQDPEAHAEVALQSGEDMVAPAAAILRAANVPFTTVVTTGDPVRSLLDVIEAEGVDMVIIGARPMGVLRSAVDGSTSRRLFQYASVPVLLVNPHPGEVEGGLDAEQASTQG
ncbi:universal stress protein [Corticibacter populi]|uniref:Universal stress protein n=1 Tax=Corticibacter populi TaxID=1550736 RepID=A0A3M6QYC1_9BURK|nr:universal stress protein [Corticibacter populi]RMX08004.1 universal stress protein [Corticibacter populi]RZS35247.1 nucleotide-binding universal stress UspA family protein [Corticibacter populi]